MPRSLRHRHSPCAPVCPHPRKTIVVATAKLIKRPHQMDGLQIYRSVVAPPSDLVGCGFDSGYGSEDSVFEKDRPTLKALSRGT
ncbi:hypothetical protein ACLKA7_007545 [Drosophila subpalustris]